MRIDGQKLAGVQPNVHKAEESERGTKPANSERNDLAVVVSIGSVGRVVAEGGVSASEAIKARLEEVRSQLSYGQYPIDFERLAASILADEVGRGGETP